MTALLAVLLAAAAAAALAGDPPNLLRARLEPVGRGTAAARRAAWMGVVRRRWPRQRQEDPDVVEACLALSAELKAGVPVPRALAATASERPTLLGPAADRLAIGGDVAAVLREAADRPGAGALRALAAGWTVTELTGAPLSRVLVAVADSLRAEAAVRREAKAQLAMVRTTARLLAALPFGTLLLLSGGDGAAVAFLFGSPYGWACLGSALLFAGAGMAWVGRLARSAVRSAWEA